MVQKVQLTEHTCYVTVTWVGNYN